MYNGDQIRETLTSLGIDIGTSTTCLIVSRITTARMGGIHAVASVEIVDREVIYRSPVHFTPLLDLDRLDSDAIFRWVNEQLEIAGVQWSQVDSGAVIITGESAGRENAREVVDRLAGHAGRFVVATAGPSLEAILAARGAGAATRSHKGNLSILNLDVGGGTTNGALFRFGEVAGTICAHVGGRLVRMDPETGRITHISPPAQRVSDLLGLNLQSGQVADPSQLWLLCTGMADGLDQLIQGGELSELAQALLIGPPLQEPLTPDAISFSGGVGREFYSGTNPRSLADVIRYGDIGPMLAAALREGPTAKRFRVEDPLETMYATVIGAGMEVLELSGSTIFLNAKGLLPLHSLPMVRPPGITGAEPPDLLAQEITKALGWFTSGSKPDHPVALALPGIKNPRYSQVLDMAAGIRQGLDAYVAQGLPVVVVLEENLGNVVGNSLATRLPPDHPIICIDQIRSKNGDYIDIGEPLYGGVVVPVVVKTLVFNT